MDKKAKKKVSSLTKSIKKNFPFMSFVQPADAPSFADQMNARAKNEDNAPTFAEQMNSGSAGEHARRRASATNVKRGSNFFEDGDEVSATPKRISNTFSETETKLLGIENNAKSLRELDTLTEEVNADNTIFVKTMGIRASEVASDLKGSLHPDIQDEYNDEFKSQFAPSEMRCLALVAHNHMKPAMKDFVFSHKEVLRKFRLTGTNTTMTMLKEAFGDDPTVEYGPSFSSGPLGGDAELCALMCLQDLGGCIFFQDPLSAHPHQADIDCLNRLCHVHNIATANNPCSAHMLCFVLKCALTFGRRDKMPSFFSTLKSPGVAVYKEQQMMALEAAKQGKTV